MYNQINIDKRLRYPVRGRVIVATTSPIVEFAGPNLDFSFPIYSVLEVPEGQLLMFCVEMDGFLMFQENTQVFITNEYEGFRSIYYDPTAFMLVRFPITKPPITVLYDLGIRGFWLSGTVRYVEVTLLDPSLPVGFQEVNVQFELMEGLWTDITAAAEFDRIAPVGSAWKGVSGYQSFFPGY